MRAVLVSPYDPDGTSEDRRAGFVGGVEQALLSNARALARRGVDVTLLSTARKARDAVVDGLRRVHVPRRGTLFRVPLSGAFLRDLDADVVHVPATYPLYSDLLLARAARTSAAVLDYHFDPQPTSRAMAAAACVYGATLARLMRRAHLVLVKSEEYAASSPHLGWVPSRRVRLVPNAVELAGLPLRTGKEDLVLCVGRLVPYKGVDVLVRAMTRVQARLPIPLVVAGDGPLRGELEALAARERVDARFLGYVPRADLVDLYGRARVTVLPSVNRQEAFGVSLLESMACGTPVVASDLDGVRGVASLGGVLAPPGDAAALAATILRVLEGRAGLPGPRELRRRVEDGYGADAVGGRLLAAYRTAEAIRCGSSA